MIFSIENTFFFIFCLLVDYVIRALHIEYERENVYSIVFFWRARGRNEEATCCFSCMGIFFPARFRSIVPCQRTVINNLVENDIFKVYVGKGENWKL